MKCPYCKKEFETTVETNGFKRLIISAFIISVLFSLIPIGIEDGYSVNWDVIMAFLIIIIFNVGMWLYHRRKNKNGR